MRTQEFKVEAYGKKLLCEICDGEMIYTGKMLLSEPPQLEHKCNSCKAISNESEKYPAVKFRNITEK